MSSCKHRTASRAAPFGHLRTFFENVHFQATVERVFIWLDINHEQFLSAHQPQLVSALRDVVAAAAKWAHVKFIVLPVPYAASLLTIFIAFMQEFNKIHDLPHNVLWLCDNERVDGARFSRSLGCNEFVTDFTSVTKEGLVRRKAVRAALRFIRQLNPSIVPEHVDLSDPPPAQQSTSSSSSVSAPNIHGVRYGKIQKPHRGNDSSRGAPIKRGGGGSRGQSTNNRGHWANNSGKPNNNRGQGLRRL
ncbi:hypothetical protein AAVH_18300 [Aphelenchoides avenae]|nr:hypothetical protein AAVH_18300 [Aphelenchus avenae]